MAKRATKIVLLSKRKHMAKDDVRDQEFGSLHSNMPVYTPQAASWSTGYTGAYGGPLWPILFCGDRPQFQMSVLFKYDAS